MNKKFYVAIIIIIAVIVFSGTYIAIKLSKPVPESIKIGWPVPITGPVASFGEPDPWISGYVTKIVNEENGGI